MNECQLAFEAFVWEVNAATPMPLSRPSLLLYDLVNSSTGALQNLKILQWNRADATLASVILSTLVPQAAKTLTELRLSSSNLPEDPSRCWQGLAAATNLRVLDLNHTGLSRQGYAKPCGTNPTVAMLAAVAGMRLEALWCAGWRFYFAGFKPLAGLGECLRSLDLTRGRDVTDSTLWSLTHLTSENPGVYITSSVVCFSHADLGCASRLLRGWRKAFYYVGTTCTFIRTVCAVTLLPSGRPSPE
jgi:hypothetical protein